MTAKASSDPLDRNTEIGALGAKAKGAVMRLLVPLCVAFAIEAAILNFSDKPGGGAFLLMGIGTIVALRVWCSDALGLPLLPLMVIQSTIIYGVPIAVGHEVIATYPSAFVWEAGVEVLIFDLIMVLAWKIGMQLFNPGPPVSYALREFSRDGIRGWSRLGFSMIAGATAFEILQSLGLTASMVKALPTGASSIVTALVSVASACGFFLVSMTLGRHVTSLLGSVFFWLLLVVNGMISASEFLLYGAAANLITVAIGFFWSSGRVPWRYLTIAMLVLSFFNTGKTIMRQRYWGTDQEPAAAATFDKLPALYGEWITVSYDATVAKSATNVASANGTAGELKENQTLLDRIDNLQNLLFVIDATKAEHVSLLNGATYSLIPPLLVPRVFWPDKPRSHEGQVILNVHFGRQDLSATSITYIAWGLLPEAYGNFGPGWGAAFIGFFMGITFAWIENLTARKLVISMEGFLSISLLMSLMNSFEMVASVLVTSIFQSFVIVIATSAPFVHRTIGNRPAIGER